MLQALGHERVAPLLSSVCDGFRQALRTVLKSMVPAYPVVNTQGKHPSTDCPGPAFAGDLALDRRQQEFRQPVLGNARPFREHG